MDLYWITSPEELHFRIHRWRAGKIDRTVAATNSIEIAHAAFEVACRIYPEHQFTLQQRGRVLRDSGATGATDPSILS